VDEVWMDGDVDGIWMVEVMRWMMVKWMVVLWMMSMVV
jgi:hypothetical protein